MIARAEAIGDHPWIHGGCGIRRESDGRGEIRSGATLGAANRAAAGEQIVSACQIDRLDHPIVAEFLEVVLLGFDHRHLNGNRHGLLLSQGFHDLGDDVLIGRSVDDAKQIG